MRQRKTVRGFRMGKAGGIEIQTQSIFPGPGNPVFEMTGFDGVAIYFLAAEFAIKCVQIQPVPAGNECQGLFQISAEFIRRACLARVIAGDGEPAAEPLAEVFKATHIVALPAVQ